MFLTGSASAMKRNCRAFTLMEAVFAVAIIGVLFVTIYGAIASSAALVRTCQENERATQILSDKLDTIRLYNWTQLTNGFARTNFVERADPLVTNSPITYTGSIHIAQAPITESYKRDMLEVTVRVEWSSGSRLQSRSMTTFIAKYGLQTYIIR